MDTTDINMVATYLLQLEVKFFETSCSPVCSDATSCKDDATDVCSAYDSGTTCAVGKTDCSTVTNMAYPVAGILDFTVVVTDDCGSIALTIAPAILSSTTINYEITDPSSHIELFDQADVSTSIGAGTCPSTYAFTVINQDLTAFDTSVFSYNPALLAFTVELADISKVASYPLTLQVMYFETACNPVCSGSTPCKDDATNACSAFDPGTTTCAVGTTDCSTTANVVYPVGGTLDFTVNILKSCLEATLTLNSAILSATTLEYEITSNSPHIEIFTGAHVTSSTAVSTCPTTYAFSAINQDSTAIDSSVFTFEGATSVFTIETEDIGKVASYPLRINVKYFLTSCSPVCSGATPCKNDATDVCSAYDSGSTCPVGNTDCSTATNEGYVDSGSLDFTVNVLQSCYDATLTLDSSILSSTTINYEITAVAPHTETFVQTSPQVTSTQSVVTCPDPY